MARIPPDNAAKSGWIICLVGFPGVGKLTIARALAGVVAGTIVDNHWINDAVLRLLPMSVAAVPVAVWHQVAKVRDAVVGIIVTLAPRDCNFIFTYAGSNEDE